MAIWFNDIPYFYSNDLKIKKTLTPQFIHKNQAMAKD